MYVRSVLRFLIVIALVLAGVPAHSQFAIFQVASALNTIQTLKVGSGGQTTNVDIQCDQGVGACNNSGTTTKVIRTDSYGAYEWCNNQWVQLVTTSSLPP